MEYRIYSAKFFRHLYFVDWPLKVFSLHYVRGMTAYRNSGSHAFKSLHVLAGNSIFVDLFRVGLLPTKSIRKLSPSNISRYTVIIIMTQD